MIRKHCYLICFELRTKQVRILTLVTISVFKISLFCCVKDLKVPKCREINSNFLVYILATQNSVESKISESQICDLLRSLFEYNDEL